VELDREVLLEVEFESSRSDRAYEDRRSFTFRIISKFKLVATRKIIKYLNMKVIERNRVTLVKLICIYKLLSS